MKSTESKLIGAGHNPADDLPRLGRKTLNSDKEVSRIQTKTNSLLKIMMKVQEEMREKQRIADLANEQRFFETTQKSDYTKQDMY